MSKRYQTIKRITIVIKPEPWRRILEAIEYCERNGYKVSWQLSGRRRGKYQVVGEKETKASSCCLTPRCNVCNGYGTILTKEGSTHPCEKCSGLGVKE